MKHCIGGAVRPAANRAKMNKISWKINTGKPAKFFVPILALSLFAACATKPPFVEIEPTILFVAEGLSPKWNELTRELIPKRINRHANASVVSYQNITAPKYKLMLRFVSADKEITGTTNRGTGVAGPVGSVVFGGGRSKSKVKTLTTLEAEASLIDQKGQSVWKWVGYSEDRDADDAVKKLGDKIAVDLIKNGFILDQQSLQN